MPEVAHLSILSSTSVISSAIKCYFSSFSAEDYGYKEVYDGGDYIEMEKGQKLTQKQLQMLEAIAEEKGNSTNPLCKEDQETFRCLKRMPRNKSNLDDDLYILGAVYTYLCLFATKKYLFKGFGHFPVSLKHF